MGIMHLKRGACRDVDPEVLHPLPGDKLAEAAAKRLCAICVVRLECLAFALDTRNLDGIWGGLTAEERRRHTRTNFSARPTQH
jgi:WhiB family redox-sensing transcriptional regulator